MFYLLREYRPNLEYDGCFGCCSEPHLRLPSRSLLPHQPSKAPIPGIVMKRHHPCGSTEHGLSRRAFLNRTALGSVGLATGLGDIITSRTAIAAQVQAKSKRVLNIFLHGGVSQLETWDPKPNTDTGGPFRAIPTSVPGMHICELLPHTAKPMHRLSIVRSLDTNNGDHARGVTEMTTGHGRMPGVDFPHIGAVTARSLMPETFVLPGHVLIRSSPGGRNVESEFHSAAYLGPRFASMALYDGNPPKFDDRPGDITDEADVRRNATSDSYDDVARQKPRPITFPTLRPASYWPTGMYLKSAESPPAIRSDTARASLESTACWPGDFWRMEFLTFRSTMPTMTRTMRTSTFTLSSSVNLINRSQHSSPIWRIADCWPTLSSA